MSWHCFLCGGVGESGWRQCSACGGWCNFVDEDTHQRLNGHRAMFDHSDGPVQPPVVIPDKMARHMDFALGREIESRSQKRRLYKENGIEMVSAKEEYRNRDKPRKSGCGFSCSYDGQKNHQSSAERGGVRSKDGREFK